MLKTLQAAADRLSPTEPEAEPDQDAIEPSSIPLDDAMGVLTNPRRRRAIRWLDEYEGEWPVTIRELTDELSTMEYGPGYTTQERKRVYVSFYQTHAETLEEAGVIEVVDRNEFEPADALPYLVDLLEAAEERFTTPNGGGRP